MKRNHKLWNRIRNEIRIQNRNRQGGQSSRTNGADQSTNGPD